LRKALAIALYIISGLSKDERLPNIGLGLFGMHQIALLLPLTEQGAAVAFIYCISMILKV